jgi:PAS domain S-box-containing protein
MDEQRLRILLVEDDEDDYLLTRHMLAEVESPRFELEWASSFGAGLEALRRGQHDAALVDNRLGSRSGVELLEEALAGGCETPIIMLTGSSNLEMDLKAMAAGAADYLEKDGLNARMLVRSIRYAVAAKRARRELAQERNLLRTVIDNIPDFIYVKDLESRFVLLNDAAMQGFDKSLDELLGKTDLDLLPPERASDHYASEQAILKSGEPLIQHEEVTFERRTGKELWMSSTKVPLRDGQGKVIGLAGISRDITERKQAEEMQARLAAIVEFSNDAIIGANLESIITSWNRGAERIYGYRADEVVGKSIGILYPADLPEELAYILNAVQRGEYIEHYETARIRKDGQRIDVSVTVSPIKNASGQVT